MRTARVVAVLLTLAAAALAGFTTALDALTAAVQARQETVDGSTRHGRREYRALVAAEDILTAESSSVGDDLFALARATRKLERRFRNDPALTPHCEQAMADLLALADEDRDRLAAAGPGLDDKRAVRRLDRAVARFDRAAEKAARAGRVSKRARRLHEGWRKVVRTEDELGLVAVPDFALVDVNASSQSSGRTLSPRDFLGKLSAYYFGHSN